MEMKDFVCFEDENGIKKEFLCEYIGNSKNVVIPSQFEVLEMFCFPGNKSMESVVIPESVKMIKSNAFSECTNLKDVQIPSNLYSVVPDAFGDAETTAKILMTNPNYIEENGLIINKSNKALLFALDTTKESYTIPADITYIGMAAFSGCSNLKEIHIPDSVDCIEMMAFFYCENLAKINFPESLKYIGKTAFLFCSSLKDFNLPEGITVEPFGNEVLLK